MIEDRERIFIEHSCRDYGKLNDTSIGVILDVAKMLDLFSHISDYEAFIDIKVTNDDLMFVVAEHLTEKSYYEYSYLGDFIYRENEPAVFEAWETGAVAESIGISINKSNGGKIITNQRAIPIRSGQEVVAILILEKSIDINGEKPAPTLARSSQISDIMLMLMEVVSTTLDLQIHEGVMFFDHEGKLLYANKYSEDLYRSFGYTSILDRHFDVLNLTSRPFADLLEAFAREHSPTFEVSFFSEETVVVGSRWFRIRFAVLASLSSVVIMFVDDITQTKRFENGNKGYLVTNREMQHRIKNNLMTVASLLRLQARQCDNDQAREIIDLGVNRILSISATFELLARGDSTAVPVLDVLRSIRDNHMAQVANTGLDLQITVSGEDFLLNSEKSTTLGLVVNELVQNAVKHAFVGRDRGVVEISTASDGGAQIVRVRDDGIGFDTEVEPDGGFGLTIIKGLVLESLHGRVTIESNESGTTVSLAFRQIDEGRREARR
ncbi:MAG: sensor histidine kinase [Coriobacteriales bacterium]|jgi:two-component sensor histidine kinase/PAS domain-containing protein|nr:sensor histidine kinase [Coriobacteriales bacterium]